MLVINAGSSSLKYSLVDAVDRRRAAAPGSSSGSARPPGSLTHRGADGRAPRASGEVAVHEDALRAALDAFDEHGPSLDDAELAAVGHRVVHGGDRFSDPVAGRRRPGRRGRATLVPLAPLHNPANLEGIEVARRLFPDLPQVAVFDTAFHQTLPRARLHLRRAAGRGARSTRSAATASTARRTRSCAGEAARLLGRPLEERQPDRAAPRQRRVRDRGRAAAGRWTPRWG